MERGCLLLQFSLLFVMVYARGFKPLNSVYPQIKNSEKVYPATTNQTKKNVFWRTPWTFDVPPGARVPHVENCWSMPYLNVKKAALVIYCLPQISRAYT